MSDGYLASRIGHHRLAEILIFDLLKPPLYFRRRHRMPTARKNRNVSLASRRSVLIGLQRQRSNLRMNFSRYE